MRRSRIKKYAIPLLVLLVLGIIGAASTNALSNTSPTNDLGYTSVTVNSPEAVHGVTYNTSDAGEYVDGVNVDFAGSLNANDELKVAINQLGDPAADPGDATPTTTYLTCPVAGSAGTPGSGSDEIYTCTTGAGGVTAALITDVEISVVPNGSTTN